MKRFFSNKTVFAAVFIMLLFTGISVAEKSWAAGINGVLRVHPENSRYFTDDSGKAIYLTGSHTWFLIQEHPGYGQTDNSYQRMEEYLDWMQSHGHNFFRVWINFAYGEVSPHPWERTGPGYAADGKLKADMTRFDESYFQLIRERLMQIQKRGMYASVMLFGSGNNLRNEPAWRNSLWHPDNNINPELAATFNKSDGNSFYTTNPDAVEIQRKLVRKTVDTLNDLDNIIWEIINEAKLPESRSWQYGMINYVRGYESGKSKQHPIGMTGGWDQSQNALKESPADWISPDEHPDNYMEGGPANYMGKVVISDTDHLWGYSDPNSADTYRWWTWKTFTRGHNPIFMDSYDSDFCIYNICNYGTIDPVFDSVRKAMGYTRSYAEKINLASMVPSSSTSDCSTTYCLRNPGQEYLVYQPGSGSFSVNLAAGTYGYEWFDPKVGNISGAGTVTVSSGNKSFTPPFSGDAVLYLVKKSADTAAPAAPIGLSVR